jgi:hypothetical protein
MPFLVTAPPPCSVCSAPLPSGAAVTCAHCGSEFNFSSPPTESPLVKRGSTPAGRRVAEVIVARFKESNRIDLAADATALQRVTEASERVAREIATKGSGKVDMPFIAAGPKGPVSLAMKLKKADLG